MSNEHPSSIDRVPRGTLIVTITVAWTLLLMIGGFFLGDMWNRLHDTEISVAKVESEHMEFRAWILRIESKLDKVIYDKFGMTFGNQTPANVQSPQLFYENSPVEIYRSKL